ncbi:MAG TPA: hypothetical protein VL463_21990 [Kofleriaceae bacterium]|nr:hypothetical protein [Kofleriaceae bacterium]
MRGTAYYDAPSMAYVSPGVQVVADYDYPVFYADNYYWRYDAGAWYRSPYYDSGWVSVSHVPYGVARVDRPWVYSHYHVRGPTYYRTGARVYSHPVPRGQRVPVRTYYRDHRRY